MAENTEIQDNGGRVIFEKDTDLINKKDWISFVMLINKLRNSSHFSEIDFPDDYFDDLSEKMPGDVLKVITKLVYAYLNRLNMPNDEIEDILGKIDGGDGMGILFEHFEGYDIQATRKESREELLVELVCKKLKKGKTVFQISDELEENEEHVQMIVDISEKYGTNYDISAITKEILAAQQKTDS